MDAKKILKIFGIAVVALVVAVVAVLKSMDFNQYKGVIANLVKDATGRDLVISGDLSLALGLSPAVVVDGVRLSNAKWGSGPTMVSVKRFEAEVALLPLLTGGVQVKRLILVEPNILLETNAKGEGNWVFSAASSAPVASADGGGGLPRLDISEVAIRNARLTYLDGKTGQKTSVGLENLSARAGGLGDPILLALTGTQNGQVIDVRGTVGALSVLTEGVPYPIDLTVKAMGLTATAKGLLSNVLKTPEAELTVSVQSGSSALSGTVKAVMAARPRVMARFRSDHVDLADFVGPGGGSSDVAAGTQKVFPADPLPLAALQAVDADVRVQVAELVAGGMMVKNVDLSASLKQGLLKVTPLRAEVFDGSVTGAVTLDARNSNRAVVTANIKVARLPLGQALQDMGLSKDIVGAPTDATIELRGRGASVAEIMATADGRILAVVGPGKIANKSLDIAGGDAVVFILGALNPASSKQEFTVLQCAVVNMPIKGGLGTLDKGLAMETERMTVVGSGRVNLATEGLDIALSMAAREGLGLNASSFAQAIKVGGTFANPAPTVDVLGAAKTGLKVGSAIATGGLSLVAGALWDKAVADDTPCLTAQGKKRQAKKAAPKKRAPPKKAPAYADPLNTLKGLFGK